MTETYKETDAQKYTATWTYKEKDKAQQQYKETDNNTYKQINNANANKRLIKKHIQRSEQKKYRAQSKRNRKIQRQRKYNIKKYKIDIAVYI